MKRIERIESPYNHITEEEYSMMHFKLRLHKVISLYEKMEFEINKEKDYDKFIEIINLYNIETKAERESLDFYIKMHNEELEQLVEIKEKGISFEDKPEIVEENKLKDINTCDLLKELEKRTGVKSRIIGPYEKETFEVEGPMTVLEIID